MNAELASRVRGLVATPGDNDYASECAGFNTANVHTPDVVVAPESVADIVESVRFARGRGYRVSIQATGHGADAPIRSGLLISTRRLNLLMIDPDTQLATIGAGAHANVVVAAAAKHGLFPILGSSIGVGAVGFLLGGGLGPLARSHGFGSDYLVGATVVTGGGDVIEVDRDHHPDLLWALRGGKSGLGVVAEARVRLVPLRTLYGGALFFDERHMDAVIRGWIDWTKDAHPQVTTSAAMLRFPPFDVIPEPFRGRTLLGLRFAYPGAADAGERLAAPLRSMAPVYLDALGEMPVTDVARIHGDPSEPGTFWQRGALLTSVDQPFASVLLSGVGAGVRSPFGMTELRHAGNATERDVEGGSAVSGCSAAFVLSCVAMDPTQFGTAVPAAFDRLAASLRPWVAAEANVNFLGAPRSEEQFARAWSPDTYAKLTEVRRRYDPDGAFAHGLPVLNANCAAKARS